MIKAKLVRNGRPILVIGLSGENMARLMAKEPIQFRGEPVGFPGFDVLICGGRTEGAIIEDMVEAGLPDPRDQTTFRR